MKKDKTPSNADETPTEIHVRKEEELVADRLLKALPSHARLHSSNLKGLMDSLEELEERGKEAARVYRNAIHQWLMNLTDEAVLDDPQKSEIRSVIQQHAAQAIAYKLRERVIQLRKKELSETWPRKK
jgi:hemerythrin